MKKSALIVHLNPLIGVTPLQGGYLKAFAEEDPEIRRSWDIQIYSRYISTSPTQLIRELSDRTPDVIGFSTHVWNSRLVHGILPVLRRLLPETQFLLGGADASFHASHDVEPRWENVITCNGEGEVAFKKFLLQMGCEKPELEHIPGITFQRAGEHIATGPCKRIEELSELPSPFLGGFFRRSDFRFALLETNRGCPYQCAFCCWGGATNQKLRRQSLPRVKEELSYLARNGVEILMIIDANFGILERDLEIAEHIARCATEHGFPKRVKVCFAKNQPERVVGIARLLRQKRIATTFSLSLQSLNPQALKLAKRRNATTQNYLQVQREFNQKRIPCSIELIWPMPGETLDSFKEGIQQLCALGARSFGVYALLLLRNTAYYDGREELGLVTLRSPGGADNSATVIQTGDVTFSEYLGGNRYLFSLLVLHDLRGLYVTSVLLNHLGLMSFRELLESFSSWLDQQICTELSLTREQGLANVNLFHSTLWQGAVVEKVLHTRRGVCDELLMEFALSLDEWRRSPHARLIRAAVEFDILCRPFVFRDTLAEPSVPLKEIRVLGRSEQARELTVEVAYDFPAMLRAWESTGTFPARFESNARHLAIRHQHNVASRRPGDTIRNAELSRLAAYEMQKFYPRFSRVAAPR